ncbi:hypothetical protein RB4972 [Rhodopirellula baltica SH 1]|uniref:Uncharacterized protein n=1 Tax=Rhodopirellula baltica (strain DSM 10527 / NCIMB 13988 / SH1) TaxID=243090 RepID=Q7UGX0_RHOBA|nr:hypothetical protein RB4972 [Rhodopirellula baltica SH 1]
MRVSERLAYVRFYPIIPAEVLSSLRLQHANFIAPQSTKIPCISEETHSPASIATSS